MLRYRIFLFVFMILLTPFSECHASDTECFWIRADTLGLMPVLVKSSGNCVEADITSEGIVRLVPLCPGETLLTVYNEYSETAEIAVIVGKNLSLGCDCRPFTTPSAYVNVLNFGAVPDDTGEDTVAIQKAIDSLPDGGTVYIPAGVYHIAYLSLRQGIHLRLAGSLQNAAVGYTDDVAAWVNSGETAILRTSGKSAHLFYNLDRGGYCTEGASHFAVSGGVIDCQNRTMAFVWACADDVLLENCIIKDCPNNHAIQIDGCSNVLIRNVMFAGYQYNGINTRETIQIEPTTAESINSNYAASPVKCRDGDFYFNKNIVITGCYFGKSDISGAHLTALGHHSVTGGKTVCDGLMFSDNVVDNPLLYGLHLLNFSNVKVTGNTFISDVKIKPLARDTALVCITALSKDQTYASPLGETIHYACANELEANKHIEISDNCFILGGSTPVRALHVEGTFFTPGATIVRGLNRVNDYGDAAYRYSGYLVNQNYVENIRFYRNDIIVQGTTRYTDYPIYASRVYDFICDENTLFSPMAYTSEDLLNGKAVPGLKASGIKNGDERLITIEGRATADFQIFLADEVGEIVAFPCHQNATLQILTGSGGSIKLFSRRDGSVVLTPIPEMGYAFVGWQLKDGTKISITAGYSEKTTLIACFDPTG